MPVPAPDDAKEKLAYTFLPIGVMKAKFISD
jgi:hypothetical protein